MKNNNKAYFVLRLTGINLDQLDPTDVGKLLENFSKLLDSDNLSVDSVYKGSAVLKISTPTENYVDTIKNFNSNVNQKKIPLKNIESTLKKYENQFPQIEATALINTKSSNDEDLESFYEFTTPQIKVKKIEQRQKFRGEVFKLLDGKDKSDHLSIILSNGNKVNVELEKEITRRLVKVFDNLWNENCIVEFYGIAKYDYVNIRNCKLKSFKADSFEIIEKQSVDSWIDDFQSCGKSGWSEFTNPKQTWIEELR